MQRITKEIPRVKDIDKDEFQRRFYLKNEPVIIEDFTKNWLAIKNWDANYLCQHLNDNMVLCSHSSTNKHPDFEAMRENRYVPKAMPFDDYIKHICLADESEIPKIAINRLVFMSGKKCSYKKHLNLDPVQNDFKVPELLSLEDLELGAIWIQGQGAQSWLHFDPYENLYVQIRGRKRILLMEPKYSYEVYYNTKKNGYCEVDVFEPDEKRFPLYLNVPVYETIINPGEMLYLPIYWFHAVESLDVINVTTNWWYRPTQVFLSQPSVGYALQRLFMYSINHAESEVDKKNIAETGLKMQELILGNNFTHIDDYYFKI